MRQHRSALVTLLAVAQLAVGSLLLFCCGFGLVSNVAGTEAQTVTITKGGQKTEMVYDPRAEMEKEAPGYKKAMLGFAVAGILLAAAMIAGGIGLLRARPWGWWLTLAWALLDVTCRAAVVVYWWTVARPAANRLVANVPRDDNNVCSGLVNGNTFYHVGWGLSAIGFALYALLVLFLLVLPPVRRACNPAAGTDDRRGGHEDEDRPRRRRYEDDEDDRPRRRRRYEDDEDEDDRPRRRRDRDD